MVCLCVSSQTYLDSCPIYLSFMFCFPSLFYVMIKGQKKKNNSNLQQKKCVARPNLTNIYQIHDSFLVDLFINFGWIAQILPHILLNGSDGWNDSSENTSHETTTKNETRHPFNFCFVFDIGRKP